jgi:hypothetical protein
MAARSLRCPLCCETFVCTSEEECEAHIASCSKFHAEFGDGPRSGLVSGFEDATSAAATRPVPAATLESACDAYAAVLLPMVAVARDGKTLEEAIDLVSSLAALLATSAAPTAPTDSGGSFGREELIEVTLGPFLSELRGDLGSKALAAIPQAIETVQRCARLESCDGSSDGDGRVAELIARSLSCMTVASTTPSSEGLATGPARFEEGERVKLAGLQARHTINGAYGRILSFVAAKGRYGVELEESKERLLIKPANLSKLL